MKRKRTPYKDQVYLDDRTWKEAGTAAGKVMASGVVFMIFVLGAAVYIDGGSEGPTDHERRQLADLADRAAGGDVESFGLSYRAKDDLKLPLAVELKPQRSKGREASRTLTQAKAPSITDGFLHKVAMAESSGDPDAKAAQGTASGLFGFTDETWRTMVDRHGARLAIKVRDKHRPHAQRIMARLLLEENAAILAKLLDRAPTHGEIYIGHVFGPKKAAELIDSTGTGKLAKSLFSQQVVQRNRPIFWNGKKPRTVEEVYRLLDRKVA